jgi:hypothetical protein
MRGLLIGSYDGIAAKVVDGGLGEALGLVLHDEDCMNNVQQHQKEEGVVSTWRLTVVAVVAVVQLQCAMTLVTGWGVR